MSDVPRLTTASPLQGRNLGQECINKKSKRLTTHGESVKERSVEGLSPVKGATMQSGRKL